MIGLKRLALLTHGAPPRNVLEAALRAKWGGGGASYEKTVGPASILSISDAKAKPAKSLIVGMEPIQAGSGDPSPDNIRPITGRTGVTVDHSGADTSDPQTYPVVFPDAVGTVYGGTVDVVTGVLTVTHGLHSFTGNEYWSFALASGHYRAYTNDVPIANYSVSPSTITDKILCCNLFPIVSWGTIYNGELGCGQTGQYVGFGMDAIGISVESDWRDYLRNNTISLVYELAEPQTYQLTPTQIQLLKGANVLWSDADDLTLTYIGTTPPNLLGGMLGGGLGGGYTPPEEEPEEEEQVPEEEQAEESDPEEVIPDGE